MIIKLASWNINSIRLRIGLIEKFSNEFEIDILCLQECKCEEKDMPYEALKKLAMDISTTGDKKAIMVL